MMAASPPPSTTAGPMIIWKLIHGFAHRCVTVLGALYPNHEISATTINIPSQKPGTANNRTVAELENVDHRSGA